MTKPSRDEIHTLLEKLRWFRQQGRQLPIGFRRRAEETLRRAGWTLHKTWNNASTLELALLTAMASNEQLEQAAALIKDE